MEFFAVFGVFAAALTVVGGVYFAANWIKESEEDRSSLWFDLRRQEANVSHVKFQCQVLQRRISTLEERVDELWGELTPDDGEEEGEENGVD